MTPLPPRQAPRIRPAGAPARQPSRVAERAELIAAAGALAAFVLFAQRFGREEPGAIDRVVSDAIAEITGPVTDAFLAPLDWGGYPGAYLPLAVAGALWLRRRGRDEGWVLPVAALGGWAAHRAAKLAYRRPRPARRPGRRRKKSSSFPSGHTVAATALYGGGALALHRAGVIGRAPATTIGVGMPALMGVSRVALDWHWATDVIGGWLLGAAVALAVGAGAERTRARAAVRRGGTERLER